ncbi:MAG: hypothetical protein ACYC0T_19130 [Ramlibacter sp.]
MKKTCSQAITGCVAASLLLAAGAAIAATASDAQLRYQQERRACLSGASNQDRATCLREAGAALQEASRGRLAAGRGSQFADNAVARCAGLPPADRDECVMRIREGRTSGSAAQGGVLRELVSPVK